MTQDHASLNALLARRVSQCMRQLGLTQRQLAARAEVDERTVRNLLDGKGVKVSTLEKIADALHVEAATLIAKAA
jgi:transcriptional regulator with XRE-family HTH domain